MYMDVLYVVPFMSDDDLLSSRTQSVTESLRTQALAHIWNVMAFRVLSHFLKGHPLDTWRVN